MKGLLVTLIGAVLCAALVVILANLLVVASSNNKIVDKAEALSFGADALVVPGAAVTPDGQPSGILADRLKGAFNLYKAHAAEKIIVSGNKEPGYDEPSVMKDYLIKLGVPAGAIECDYAGYTTYETMYRVKEIFKVERAIVCTQRYHLYRAIFAGESLGMRVVGFPTDFHEYARQGFYELRELGARTKAAIFAILKPAPRTIND